MTDYLTTDRLIELKGSLSESEIALAGNIIPIVCAELRVRADELGKDLDKMIESSEDLSLIAESVVADITMREIDEIEASSESSILTQATQVSESALGYSQSFSLPNSGGGLFIKRSELARLGLRRQRYGVIEMWEASDD